MYDATFSAVISGGLVARVYVDLYLAAGLSVVNERLHYIFMQGIVTVMHLAH